MYEHLLTASTFPSPLEYNSFIPGSGSYRTS